MPYLNCIIKEIFRFGTITPLLPHGVTKDDVCAKYYIPKSSPDFSLS